MIAAFWLFTLKEAMERLEIETLERIAEVMENRAGYHQVPKTHAYKTRH